MKNELNLPVLTDSEKAVYDTIKQVAQGPRPDDLALQRMAVRTPDGGIEPVGVISQKVIRKEDATFLGWQPLAVIVDDDLALSLLAPDGSTAASVDPSEAEGAGGP